MSIRVAIARHEKEGVDQPDYFWIGFEESIPYRWYDAERDASNTHGSVRWSTDGRNYGQGNLTDEGQALFDSVTAMLGGHIDEIWYGWKFRHKLGDMIRVHLVKDADREAAIEDARIIFRRLYGQDFGLEFYELDKARS